MTRNRLEDLNDHLFAQLERLNDEDLSGDDLDIEIQRAHAVSRVAGRIVENANVVLNAAKFNDSKLDANLRLPPMLSGGVDQP